MQVAPCGNRLNRLKKVLSKTKKGLTLFWWHVVVARSLWLGNALFHVKKKNKSHNSLILNELWRRRGPAPVSR